VTTCRFSSNRCVVDGQRLDRQKICFGDDEDRHGLHSSGSRVFLTFGWCSGPWVDTRQYLCPPLVLGAEPKESPTYVTFISII
jgi:hypothetical protein